MNTNTPEFEFVPAIAEIAREAGILLMGYFQTRIKVEYKGDVDLVTVADRESEALILSRIREQWPSHDVMGEEGTRIQTGSDYLWYIDPLDGTTNFAHGFPVFCVSLALEKKGKRSEVFFFVPPRHNLFAPERGRGPSLNKGRIKVWKGATLAKSLGGKVFPSHKRHKNPNIFFYHQITLRSHGVRRAGSA